MVIHGRNVKELITRFGVLSFTRSISGSTTPEQNYLRAVNESEGLE